VKEPSDTPRKMKMKKRKKPKERRERSRSRSVADAEDCPQVPHQPFCFSLSRCANHSSCGAVLTIHHLLSAYHSLAGTGLCRRTGMPRSHVRRARHLCPRRRASAIRAK
jgi:hypothetical protein